jgi:hypothetical protein
MGKSPLSLLFSSNLRRFVALTPNYPSKIVPANLGRYGRVIVKGGSYMGSTGEVKVSADCDCNCCSCCCGGMGMVRQAAEGSGTVFLNAGGTVVQKVTSVSPPLACSLLSLCRSWLRGRPSSWTPTPSLASKKLSNLVFNELAAAALVVLVARGSSTRPSPDPAL